MQTLNSEETQIQSFIDNNAGIPLHLALCALVLRFCEGWDRSSLTALTDSELVRTVDWADLQDSPAWGFASEHQVKQAILDHIESLKSED